MTELIVKFIHLDIDQILMYFLESYKSRVSTSMDYFVKHEIQVVILQFNCRPYIF